MNTIECWHTQVQHVSVYENATLRPWQTQVMTLNLLTAGSYGL